MDRKIVIIIFVSSFLFSQNLVDRFKSPIAIKTKIGLGYDSNFLRLSANDIDGGKAYNYGIVSTVDSPIIKPTMKFSYNPVLFDDHKTNFIYSFSYNYFNQSLKKSYLISNVSLEFKLKSYSWIKFGFRDIPKFYLRDFIDRDSDTNNYKECFFSSQTFFSSYSFPLKWFKRAWIKAQYKHINEFYNSYFTEFDLKKDLIQFELNYKMKNNNSIKTSFSYGEAKNINFNNSNLVSTYIDRSFSFGNMYLSFIVRNYDLKKIDKFGFSHFLEIRLYDMELSKNINLLPSVWNFTEEANDWDGWKRYMDGKFIWWIDWDLLNDIAIKTSYSYRWRKPEYELYDNMDWIADAKKYVKHEVWLEFSYQFITDLLY